MNNNNETTNEPEVLIQGTGLRVSKDENGNIQAEKHIGGWSAMGHVNVDAFAGNTQEEKEANAASFAAMMILLV